MPTSLSSDQPHQLARLGAQARLEELRTEMAAIEALIGERDHGGARRGRRPGRPAGRESKRPGGRKRGKLSAAGRRAIAAAQRARWAKIKAAKGTSSADGKVNPAKAQSGAAKKASGPRKRRGMSVAVRKTASERMKKYWAARRAKK